MKINTDGVLLGAMARADAPQQILDIGTGTGVIALMVAQRYPDARTDAVEIDTIAAETAARNFQNSVFGRQLQVHPKDINDFWKEYPDKKYDLIISNPPFYINSLESPEAKKNLAKHSDVVFFEGFTKEVSKHLSPAGLCWLVLPVNTAAEVKHLAEKEGLVAKENIFIKSFSSAEAHREIVCFGWGDRLTESADFVIYDAPGVYTDTYKKLLKPYFLAF
ncbi:MAG TPA: methyltransferase [Mucilaginibacter sp.]